MANARTLTRNAAELIEDHLPLVEHIARRVSVTLPRHVERNDLVGAGTLGLVEAALRFEPAVGVPFARFASPRIRGAIVDLLRTTDWAPRSVRSLAREMDRAEHALAAKFGRHPDDEEIATAIKVGLEELAVLRCRVKLGSVVRIDTAGSDGGRSALHGVYDRCAATPDEFVEFTETRGYVRDALDRLPSRHRVVAIGYYLEGLSFDDLAGLLEITPSRVSQVRAEAVAMMREGIDSQYDARGVATEPATGRVARRRRKYASAIAGNSSWRERFLAVDEPILTHLPPRASCAVAAQHLRSSS